MAVYSETDEERSRPPPPPPQPGDLYREVGGALYARLVFILDDAVVARRAADELFVRFMTRRQVAAGARARPDASLGSRTDADTWANWIWIYRVATNDALQRLADASVPAGGSPVERSGPPPPPPPAPARRALPSMAELRRLDELHANARVLTDLDGLSGDELLEVLGALPPRSRAAQVAASARSTTDDHPSRLRLEAQARSPEVAEHVKSCLGCAGATARARHRRLEFAQQIGTTQVEEMEARIGAALAGATRRRGRPRIAQAVIVTSSLLAVCVLALWVARPRAPLRAEAPYAGSRGASLVKASGIQIYLRRDDITRVLDSEASLRPGDHLLFRVRTERPRFLELRARQSPTDTRIFPRTGDRSVLVTPGQAIDAGYAVSGSSPVVWIAARFADQAFALDVAPGPDVEVVPVRIPVAMPDAAHIPDVSASRVSGVSGVIDSGTSLR